MCSSSCSIGREPPCKCSRPGRTGAVAGVEPRADAADRTEGDEQERPEPLARPRVRGLVLPTAAYRRMVTKPSTEPLFRDHRAAFHNDCNHGTQGHFTWARNRLSAKIYSRNE